MHAARQEVVMTSEEKSALLPEDKSVLKGAEIAPSEAPLAVNGKLGLGAWLLSKSGICSHRWAGRRYGS